MRRRAGGVAVSAAVAALILLGGSPAVAADEPGSDPVRIEVTVPERTADPAADGTVTNAQLRWGLSREATGGAFAGGCNFLSAGRAGDSGSARVWAAGDGLYSARSGAVSILKATADGGWTAASWATKCLDPQGVAVSVASASSTTQSQVVIDGGTGGRTEDGGLRISWAGSFTVAFYGGMTYWSASDPVLTLDASGNGQVTATASGYGTSMEDLTRWEPLAPRSIVLAELRGVAMGTSGGGTSGAFSAGGFVSTPQYLGVPARAGLGQVSATTANAAYWGAFPASFLEFQTVTGQTGYWLTTGGQRDPAKPPTALTVNYDAAAPAFVPAVEASAASAAASNPLSYRPGIAEGHAGWAGGGSPVALTREDGSFVPPAVAAALEPLLLPLGGTLLAALVAALSVLQLTGRLRLPGLRRP